MSALAATVFVSSLAGSLHCIAMCGPLVAAHGATLRLALVHALGRLATYATFGALAGGIGHVVNLASVQHAAAIAAGVAIVAWGLHGIAVARGWIPPRRATGALFRSGLVQLHGRRATARAALLGVLTGLLPCGWLWAFVVTAAGTGGVLSGAGVMLVFWLGTVPAMTGALTIAGPAIARVRARLPALTACVLVALGVTTLALRWNAAGPHATCHCHEVVR